MGDRRTCNAAGCSVNLNISALFHKGMNLLRSLGMRIGIALLTILCFVPCSLGQASSSKSRKTTKPEDNYPTSLSREIHHQLLMLPYYSVFDAIAFAVDGSKVTLTGQVVRPTLKTEAEATVKSLEGVLTLVNKIEVLPASPADDELRRSVYRAIFEDSTLAHYAIKAVPPIHIIVKNGNVALEGRVDSVSDKNLAAARARGVAGVHSVENNLVVQPKGSTAQ
jgi:hyperosmotically inducible protein